jgi:hypothetical protein
MFLLRGSRSSLHPPIGGPPLAILAKRVHGPAMLQSLSEPLLRWSPYARSAAAAACGSQGSMQQHMARAALSFSSSFATTAPAAATAAVSTHDQLGASIQWVFLGAPGVGKGTYASRAAKHFQVAHIATGDLIRAEIKQGSALGKQVSAVSLHACRAKDRHSPS